METVRFKLGAGPLVNFLVFLALLMAVRGLRNFRNEKAIVLDANRLVLSGCDLTGQDRVLYFADIVSVAEFTTRGIQGVELTARDGSKLALASVLLQSPQDYARFKDLLMQRVSLLVPTLPR